MISHNFHESNETFNCENEIKVRQQLSNAKCEHYSFFYFVCFLFACPWLAFSNPFYRLIVHYVTAHFSVHLVEEIPHEDGVLEWAVALLRLAEERAGVDDDGGQGGHQQGDEQQQLQHGGGGGGLGVE